jgi:hypothetical protein
MSINREDYDQYDDYFYVQLEKGREYEDFVRNEFSKRGLFFLCHQSRKWQYERGDTSAGIEIKQDTIFSRTQQLWIEVEEKRHPDNPHFVKAGIYRDDGSYLYAIGDRSKIFLFGSKQLRRLHRAQRDGKDLFERREIPTSKCFLIPVEQAEELYALTVLNLDSPCSKQETLSL